MFLVIQAGGVSREDRGNESIVLRRGGKGDEIMKTRHTKIFMGFHWFHCICAVMLVDSIKPGSAPSRVFRARLPVFTTSKQFAS